MASVQKFSSQVIDYAERLSTMADAAEGKRQKTGAARWLLLPASGAALYALVRSDSFSRQAKGVMKGAKTRAAELPDDLLTRVRETTRAGETAQRGSSQRGSGNGSGTTRRSRSRRTAKSSSS
jgi:hypothetical protein